MIDLDQIRPGDELMITDALGNTASGPVAITGGAIDLGIFATRVRVAALGRDGHWQAVNGVKIIRHQPGLFEAPEPNVKPRTRRGWNR